MVFIMFHEIVNIDIQSFGVFVFWLYSLILVILILLNHFQPKGEDIDVSRDELSRALMVCNMHVFINALLKFLIPLTV